MDWDKLKIFHAVAEAGSFTNATVNLNLSQSAISRQIQSLEDDLKVKLFERHARGLTLTENGEYVYKTAHEVISKLKEVETSLGDQKDKPSGKITITTVRSFGTHWLTPRIQEFMQLNPEIEVEFFGVRFFPMLYPGWHLKMHLYNTARRSLFQPPAPGLHERQIHS